MNIYSIPVSNLSYSAISSYLMCGQWWKFKKVLKLPTPHSDAAFFGSVFHKAAQTYLVQDASDKTSLQDLWLTTWEVMLKEWEAHPGGFKWSNDPAAFMHEGFDMCRNVRLIETLDQYHVLYDDGGPFIERRFEFMLPDVEVPIVGYIDLVAENGIPLDFKVTSRAWSEDKARKELQPLFYLYALREMGREVRTFTHFVVVRGRNIGIQIINSEFDPGEFEYMIQTVQNVWSGIKAGIYQMAPADHWKCTPKWCEFWDQCRGNMPGRSSRLIR